MNCFGVLQVIDHRSNGPSSKTGFSGGRKQQSFPKLAASVMELLDRIIAGERR